VDFIEGIRIRSLLDVLEGDFDYQYRRICRWYSTTFHTPLSEVDSLPVDWVLRAFFESNFERLNRKELRKLAIELTETPEEQKKRKAKEKSKSDDAFARRAAKMAKQEAIEREAKKKATEKIVKAKIEAEGERDMLDLPSPPDLPDFSMTFDERGNLLKDKPPSP